MGDSIILMGLNKSSEHEAAALRAKGNTVHYIGDSAAPNKIRHNGKNYNLSNRSEISAFVKTLGLNSAEETNLISAIENGGPDIRDELAQFASVLTELEKKGATTTRFILSGHSIGTTYWGDGNGMLEISDVKKVAASIPNSALIIEDLHLSACYSGKEKDIKEWRKVFPNVKTIWAYSGSAPGSYSGATVHQHRWDGATRGVVEDLDRSVAFRTRKGKNVVVWSKKSGYVSGAGVSITVLENRIISAESTYQAFYNGTRNVVDTQNGPLRHYYNDLQALMGHALVTPSLQNRYRPRLEAAIRLIYFDKKIKSKFASHHAALINRGYRALGMAPPGFAGITRKQCLDRIREFSRRAGSSSSPDVQKLKDELVNGLKELKSSHIPSNWI